MEDVLLTPQWKKDIIPKILSNLNSLANLDTILEDIINATRHYYRDMDINVILYKNEVYTHPREKEIRKYVKTIEGIKHLCDVMEMYIRELKLQKHKFASLNNYITTGIAMSHTIADVCELFPQFILDIISINTENYSFFVIDTVNPKYLEFIKKYDSVRFDLQKKLAKQILTQSQNNASN